MKIAKTVLLFSLLQLGAAQLCAQPCVLPITPNEALLEQKFGVAYKLPIGVKSVEIKSGPKKTELEGFYLTVTASYLGAPYPNNLAEAHALPALAPQPRENWFRRNIHDELQYLVFPQLRGDCQPDPALWQNQRSQVQIQWGQTKKLLHELSDAEAFGDFSILSTAKMKQDDIISMSSFFLKPTQPGLYRIVLALYRVHQQQPMLDALQETRRVYVYFSCPDYQPQLMVQGEGTIQLQESKYNIHLPIVNNVFFEEDEPARFAANRTDSLFRAMLFGRAVERLACDAREPLQLLLFPDPLAHAKYYDPERSLAISRSRAEHLQFALDGLTHAFHAGQKCGAGSSGARRSCALQFVRAEDRSGELYEAYIKHDESRREPVKFREENRVVPLETRNAFDDSLLFAPLVIKPKEYPRHVEVTLNIGNRDALAAQCLEAGWVTVTSVKRGQVSPPLHLTPPQLQALREDSLAFRLDTLESFFSESGEYAAQLSLRSSFTETVLNSKSVAFRVKAQAILLDEIFALSPYDNATFKYQYDSRRIPQIIHLLLNKADSMLAQNSASDTIVAQVLISGHTDTLAEHKGPYYNLGLSFRRAQAARDSLLFHLRFLAPKQEFILEAGPHPEESYVSDDMQQRMRSLPHAKEATQAFFQSLQIAPRRSTNLAQRYDFLKFDRLRHFRLPPEVEPRIPPALDSLKVARRIDEVAKDVAQSYLLAVLRKGKKRLMVHFVAAGFGDKIPFYRRMHITPEYQRMLCAGGYARPVPLDQIDEIYANDSHPAGRVMNRRIEVSLIFDKDAAPRLPFVRK